MNRIVIRETNPDSVTLDLFRGTGNGTQLQLWDCNDTAAQAWHLPWAPRRWYGRVDQTAAVDREQKIAMSPLRRIG
jgi:hypothetical protein